jgi:hypothetical protein
MMSRAPVYKPVRNAGLASFVASRARTACEAEDVAGSIIVGALAANAFLHRQRLSWLPDTEHRETQTKTHKYSQVLTTIPRSRPL